MTLIVYNVPGDCRSWQEAARALKEARPNLEVSVGEDVDPALEGIVEHYDAGGFAERYGYRLLWSLAAGVRVALDTYDTIDARS